MKCNYGFETLLMTGGQHSPVMVQLRQRKFTVLGFDASPFDGKAVSVEAEASEQRNVVAVTMIMIAGIARRFRIDCAIHVFQQPRVGIDISTLYLMGRGRCSPEKPLGKPHSDRCSAITQRSESRVECGSRAPTSLFDPVFQGFRTPRDS